MNNLIGKSLGRYHILEQLGEGGMATVYKAFDTSVERDVAIKVIRAEQFADEIEGQTLTRFKREAKALAKLSHPNIVTVYDFGQIEDLPYLVMEYMPGGTLEEKLTTRLPWRKAFNLLLPIANALGFAHSQGILHRDVKSSNILITPSGEPLLSDFGIAKILDVTEGNTITLAGVGVGTPEYMAPEQGMEKKMDSRVDIYSLGVVLYEAISGRKPYTAETPLAVLFKHANEPLPRPKSIVPELPLEVEQLLIKLLAKDPENRFQSMELLTAAMQQLLDADLPDDTEFSPEKSPEDPTKKAGMSALDSSLERRIGRKLAARRWMFALAGGLIILLTVASLFFKPLAASNLQLDNATAGAIIAPEKTSTPIIIPTETKEAPTVIPTITPTPIGGAEQVAYINNDSNQVNIQPVFDSEQVENKVIDNSAVSLTSLWSSPDFKKVAWESESGFKIYDSQTKSSQSFPIHNINNIIWHDNSEKITIETNTYYNSSGSYYINVMTLAINSGEVTEYSSCMNLISHIYLQAVSPDGETIIVLEYIHNGSQIIERLISVSTDCQNIYELYEIIRPYKYVLEAGGLLKKESPFQGVSWSSNSRQLVVSLYGDLFILDKTGENKNTLAGWATEKAAFSLWLPDSSLVYYLTEDSMIEINTDTKEKETIGDFNDPLGMVLSPNKDHILIVDVQDYSDQQLWIYKVKENELVHLTDALPSDTRDYRDREYVRNFVPSWSPDGKWIAYLSDDKAELINVDGGSNFTLPGNPYSGFLGYDLAWLK